MLYYKHMRFKMPLLSLLFVLAFGFFAPLFLINSQPVHAALGAFPSEDVVKNQRKFYYEKLSFNGVEKLSIYTVQCQDRNNCATVEQRGIMERWLASSFGGDQSDSLIKFGAVSNDGKTADTHSPDIFVQRSQLDKGGVSGGEPCNSTLSNEGSKKCITFAVNNIEVAQAMLSKDSTAGSNQDGGAIGANGQNQNVEPSTPGSATPEADAENSTSCEDSGVGNLGWIMCPVILAIDGGLNWVDSRINELLEIDADYYDNPEIRNAFSSIQRVAYIILVPVMLVMVISTALGFEFVSAYTVKKALPRLVMAVIFISVAYPLCVFLIQFFDSIGKGVVGLITSPFETKYGALTLSNLFEGNILTGIVTGFGGAVASIILLWLFGGTILLFAGVAFLVLLLRQMFVVALLLLAPVAILAWIFPGNDKLWNAWWGSFSKLLMMYPIIMGLIAIGRVFAFIIHSSNRSGAESVLQPIMIIIAYMIPYAFIPFTFKLAGGTFATLAGMADNKSKGLFDRQRETRKGKLERAQQNRAWNEHRGGIRGAVAKRANTIASVATSNPWDTANIYGFGRGVKHATSRGRSILSQIDASKYQQTMGLQEALGKHGISNDRALTALAGRNSAIGTIRTAKDLQQAISKLNEGDAQDRIGASQLQNAYSFLSDLHTNPDYGRGSLEGAALMSWSSQGFAGAEDIASVSNSIGGGLGASIANQATFLGYKAGGRPDLKPSYGVQIGKDGKFFDALNTKGKTGAELENAVASQAKLVTGLKMQDLMNAKSGSIKSMKDGMKRLVSTGDAPGASEEDRGRAKAIRQTVIQSASAFSQTDVESRRQWQELAAELGVSPEEQALYDQQLAARQGRGEGGEGQASAEDH